MQTVCLGPRRHAPIFQTVAAADNGLKERNILACLSCLFFLEVQRGKGVGDQNTGVWTKAVVIQDEVSERDVARQKGDERGLGVETEGVVVKIDCVQFGECD